MYDQIFDGVNAHRSTPLQRDFHLDIIARAHAKWMAENHKLSHEGSPTRAVQMRQRGYTEKAENVACSNTFDAPGEVVRNWVGSSGHYQNLSNPMFTHTGIGYSRSNRDGTYYFAQIFGGDGKVRSTGAPRSSATRSVGRCSVGPLSGSCVDRAESLLQDALVNDEHGVRSPELIEAYLKVAGLYLEAIRPQGGTTVNNMENRELKKKLEMVLARAERLKGRA